MIAEEGTAASKAFPDTELPSTRTVHWTWSLLLPHTGAASPIALLRRSVRLDGEMDPTEMSSTVDG